MSDSAVEFLERFLLPFIRKYTHVGTGFDMAGNADDVIMAWFNADKRMMVKATAKRDFKMPGLLATASGGRWAKKVPTLAHREILKGDKLLFVMDSREQSTKVEILKDDQLRPRLFKLSRAETEFLKDQVNWSIEE